MNKARRFLVTIAAATLALSACGKSPSMAPPYSPVSNFGTPPAPQPQFGQQNALNTAPQASHKPAVTSQAPKTAPSRSSTPGKPTNATTSRSKTKSQPAARPLAGQVPAPAQRSSQTQSLEDQLLAKARAAFEQVNSASAMVDTFEKSEKGAIKGKLRYIFQKPTLGKLEILDHTIGNYKGAQIVYGYDSSGNVKGKAGGLLSFMKLTVPITDTKVTTRRNYRIDSVDMAAIVRRLTQPGQQVKALGKIEIGGSPIAVLEYLPKDHFDPKITRELLGLDMNTNMVRMHEMYEGNELVYSVKISQLIPNPNLEPKAFEL